VRIIFCAAILGKSAMKTLAMIRQVFWEESMSSWLPAVDVLLPLGSRTVPGLSSKLLTATAHNN
jgi:hypothetical protein